MLTATLYNHNSKWNARKSCSINLKLHTCINVSFNEYYVLFQMDVRQEVVWRLQVVLAVVRQLVDDPETEDPMCHTLLLLMVWLENVLQDN